jgi:hypothetical protein
VGCRWSEQPFDQFVSELFARVFLDEVAGIADDFVGLAGRTWITYLLSGLSLIRLIFFPAYLFSGLSFFRLIFFPAYLSSDPSLI